MVRAKAEPVDTPDTWEMVRENFLAVPVEAKETEGEVFINTGLTIFRPTVVGLVAPPLLKSHAVPSLSLVNWVQ